MPWFTARPFTSSFAACPWPAVLSRRPFAAARSANNASEEELQVARKWLEKLHADTIPQNLGELSFSRSSGPGGQNVNKYDHAIYSLDVN